MIDTLLGRPMDYRSLYDAVQRLEAENERLALSNAKLRAENRRLVKANHTLRADIRRIRRAHRDAVVLAVWNAAGLSTSRRDSLEAGMSERSWTGARAMLLLARVHTGRHFTTTDPAELQTALDRALHHAEKTPTAWRARLPRCRTR